MKTVELFCGTKSFSKYAKKLGHDTFTVDKFDEFEPDLTHDLLEPFPKELQDRINQADIIWMSPPCQVFSLASGKSYWTRWRTPRNEKAKQGKAMLDLCIDIAHIATKTKKIFFIENPMARARWFMPSIWLKEVWYCRYGDKIAKPTDIWTNLVSWRAKRCYNNNPFCDHERSPRGTKSGTQGLDNAKERGRIPEQVFVEIFEEIEKGKLIVQKTLI